MPSKWPKLSARYGSLRRGPSRSGAHFAADLVGMNIFPVALSLALALAGSPALAAEPKCEGPETSTRFEACSLIQHNEKLTRRMQDALEQAQSLYKESNDKEKWELLAEAQRAWGNYRDTVCAYEQSANGGMYGISWHRCNADMLAEQLDYLLEVRSNFGDSH